MLEIIPNNLEITREIYTVSQLNQLAKSLLEGTFPLIWLSGEISNLSQPSSGHMYFTLKDETAQVRCAMFRFRNSLLSFTPQNGMQVLARAKVSLYEGRGEFQLIIEQMEEAGDGALRRAFELLKHKLAAQGLFNSEHKKTLPAFPKSIGVITSPTGAAIKDIISVLKRRMPLISIIIYPTAVQGSEAAAQIVKAIELANHRQECDVLIVGRGGGSLEDLWPFNEESVAHAIFNSELTIISAVGHEIDYTIADFVADVRAPTPSAAAELVSPQQTDLLQHLQLCYQSLSRQFNVFLQQAQQQIIWLTKRLQHPKQRLQTRAQQLDYLEQRLLQAQKQRLHQKQAEAHKLAIKLQLYNPQNLIKPLLMQHASLCQRLNKAVELLIKKNQTDLAQLSGALHNLSPLATLQRGYAIAYKQPEQTIVHNVTELQVGDKIINQLHQGKIHCIVEKIDND
ncbi:MAG: exodeoxyribonuclease large subunit [Gammaproteobacteria bacterium]|jgi:exodeoxyribonuclease VII large subunit|nr:exodeoxyribonuclease large subunit [Gammaproteobacteria bacterium]